MAKHSRTSITIVGVISIAIGLFIMVVVTQVESESPRSLLESASTTKHSAAVSGLVAFLEHLSVALFSFGIISILLEMRHWDEYFKERIVSVVTEDGYLAGQSAERLERLEANVMRAYFGRPDVDGNGSFYEFYRSQIKGYMGSPYREDVRSSIDIRDDPTDTGWFDVTERISYVCRSVSGKIQPSIQWEHGDSVTQHDFLSFCVKVVLPVNAVIWDGNRYSGARRDYNVTNREIDFGDLMRDGHYPGLATRLKSLPHSMIGYTVSLIDFLQLDGLMVKIEVRYRRHKTGLFVFQFGSAARKASFDILYPDHYRISTNEFGLPLLADFDQHDDAGHWVGEYSSWMLPRAGMAFVLVAN